MWELDHKEGRVPKNWCFELWCWRSLVRVPLDCKEVKPVNPKGNQSWIFTGRLMLKLKLQHFGYLMWRADSLEKTLMLGKIEGRRRREWQRMRWLDIITNPMDMNLHKLWEEFKQAPEDDCEQGRLACYSTQGHKELDVTEWVNK